MPEDRTPKYDPSERVEHMNRIFDRLVLPMIIVTVVIFGGFAIFSKPSCSCITSSELTGQDDGVNAAPNAYVLRKVLLEDMEKNRGIFEAGGYTLVENEASGWVAYIALDEQTEVFDNLTDGSGGRYSAVTLDDGQRKIVVRIYSEHVFLVEVVSDDSSRSAVFCDDGFATFTSGSDADVADVLSVVSAQELSELTGLYKRTVLSLIGE